MNAELLTYSRSKGAFAGLTLEGAVIEQDEDSTIAIYGKDVGFRKVLTGHVTPPADAAPFMSALSLAGHQAAAHEAKEASQDKNEKN
jgi:lipid-binding SYLF domain-containing protein